MVPLPVGSSHADQAPHLFSSSDLQRRCPEALLLLHASTLRRTVRRGVGALDTGPSSRGSAIKVGIGGKKQMTRNRSGSSHSACSAHTARCAQLRSVSNKTQETTVLHFTHFAFLLLYLIIPVGCL
ncbi:hypothetical protein NDU88_001685 [Pleurodeles waltl]|uniref:Uncharacterized protein n=1 Tax=Pleurodeles waltl TaxID=8319 RepID=A0AAV7M097_PLEWA|nr:hypothetical protein NDU88_001685 [Pleurodeles waltl]